MSKEYSLKMEQIKWLLEDSNGDIQNVAELCFLLTVLRDRTVDKEIRRLLIEMIDMCVREDSEISVN